MFREYMEFNSFVRFVRVAFEDGFAEAASPIDSFEAENKAAQFSSIAAKCAPAGIQSGKIQVFFGGDGVRQDDIKLKTILRQAWVDGKDRRIALMENKETESFDEWRKRLESIDSYINTESRRYALSVAQKHKGLADAGNDSRQWLLSTGKDVACGYYYGPQLKKGDLVEYGFQTLCRVLGVSENKANVARMNTSIDGRTIGDCSIIDIHNDSNDGPLAIGDVEDFEHMSRSRMDRIMTRGLGDLKPITSVASREENKLCQTLAEYLDGVPAVAMGDVTGASHISCEDLKSRLDNQPVAQASDEELIQSLRDAGISEGVVSGVETILGDSAPCAVAEPLATVSVVLPKKKKTKKKTSKKSKK